VPVTALGPARVGSTQTLCRWLERSNIGCLGASVTVLQDIAFINLLLPVAPARVGDVPDEATSTPAVDGFGPIASSCGLTTEQRTHREGNAQRAIDTRPVADYVLLAGSPVPCTFERRQKSGLPTRFPIWVAWDMPPAGVEAADVLRTVTDALAGFGPVEVAFARSRRGERGRLLGRAKLSIVPRAIQKTGQSEVTGLLGTIAARAQDTAARRLAVQLGIQAADVRLQVAWRERWLAHLGTGI
jgi:hypothetical protein